MTWVKVAGLSFSQQVKIETLDGASFMIKMLDIIEIRKLKRRDKYKQTFKSSFIFRLSQYLAVLQAQEVDFYTFLTLTEEDLKELGISSFGAKKKLVAAILGTNHASTNI